MNVESLDIETKPFVNFTEVCRICLIKSNEMRQLTDLENPEVHNLIAQLVSVANLKLEVGPNLPNYLCWSCEEKLKLSYDFQQLCFKSEQIIKSYLDGNSDKIIFNELVKDEFTQVKIDVGEPKKARNTSKNESKKKICNKSEGKKYKGSRRLQIVPDEKIREAVKVYKERYEQPKICFKCKFLTKNANALAVHMSRKHPEVKGSWCYLCNEECNNLSLHKKLHIKTDNKCQFCNKTFQTPQHYLEHLRSHSETRSFSCKKCNVEYHYRSKLIKHLRTEHNTTDLKIKKGKIVDPNQDHENESTLTLTDIASANQELYEYSKQQELCPYCGKQFNNISKLNVHIRIHTGVAPYRCKYCDKCSTTINYLKIHERTHTGERPYICNYCGKAFSQQSSMHIHKKRHTGETINCTVCDKTFCRKSELKVHMRSHAGEKPYSCDVCNRAFKQRSHLMEHLNTHKESGDFQCQYCEKNFKAKSTLKTHLLIHTGSKPYKCMHCSYECRRNFNLKKHLEQHNLKTEIIV